ncbi:MAG: helix-turn-helix transcriptional regulator, partial [Clostridia bacterium]|nr:helix-turn-helix transcriptional regulator [Clostridia bacterium]
LILTDNTKKYVFLKNGEELTSRIYGIIMDMHGENLREEVGFDMIIRGYINILLGMFYRYNILENVWDIYTNEAIRKIRPALEYIDDNYRDEITLKSLADTIHVNREYFCRTFKKATNITPTEYINHVRIWKAEGLLTTTDKSILEVATDVGFSSVSYFNRVFRKFKTTTPSAYREILYAKNKLI